MLAEARAEPRTAGLRKDTLDENPITVLKEVQADSATNGRVHVVEENRPNHGLCRFCWCRQSVHGVLSRDQGARKKSDSVLTLLTLFSLSSLAEVLAARTSLAVCLPSTVQVNFMKCGISRQMYEIDVTKRKWTQIVAALDVEASVSAFPPGVVRHAHRPTETTLGPAPQERNTTHARCTLLSTMRQCMHVAQSHRT